MPKLKGRTNPAYQHGHNARGKRTPEYTAWAHMLGRCRNANSKDFHHYGGRGIKVCKRWHKFENFLADMGERPPGRSLDRKNNNGNYTPDNCRWATQKEQMANTRLRKNAVLINGRTIPDLAKELGISYIAAWCRHKKGKLWPAPPKAELRTTSKSG